MAISKVLVDSHALHRYVRQSVANTADMWLRLQELRIRIAALGRCDLDAYGFSRGDVESVLDGIAAAGRTNSEIDEHVKDTRRRAEAADRVGDILGPDRSAGQIGAALGSITIGAAGMIVGPVGGMIGGAVGGMIGGWAGSIIGDGYELNETIKITEYDDKPRPGYVPPANSAEPPDRPEQASKARDLDPAQRVAAIKTKIEQEMGRLPDPSENAEGEECVAWARLRRDKLDGTPLPATGAYPKGDDVALYGAWNYNHIYQGATRPFAADPLAQQSVVAGDALISRPTTGNPWGHIAIVEAVYPDGLIISQANVKQAKIVRFVPRDELASWLRIPADASPTEAQS